MKQRIFLTTLALFLFFFNLGIFIVSVTMFRDTVNRAEERILGEHYFIASALLKDFIAVESRGADLDGSISLLLKPYSYLSGDNKTRLALYKNDQLIYSDQNASVLEDNSLKPPVGGNRLATIRKASNQTYVIVSGKLSDPYHSYTLVYLYDTTEAISSWSHLKNNLFLAGFALSILLAFGLLLVLNRIFRPFKQISRTAKDIAGGAYETRLPVSGGDELSEMAQSFNHMAEEIQLRITELKNAADQKQQFVDNFAHELRTPLTAIYGYAEYIQKAVMSEDDSLSALQYIMSESRRLQTIAFQLLELANLQNNPLTCEELKVSDLFHSVRQTLYGKLAGKYIQIEFCSEIETIRGDVSLLESLLINLIDNAIKACGKDGHIDVRAAMENEKKTISVQDNGKGMTQEVLSQITEPFYRGEKSRNRNDGGAGLGLAICKQIASSHGAELSFISRPGEGTTAKITFTTSQ
ncbi:sensor histidine kinase [Ruminiclostridium cellobioparum]|uniref:histidine kinase n=1 Tax=Ruminiclostridium cellobioparum subsp. termitidis CT1112 TaxID=1195236 RepID=S0FKF6_RUMCE|nr:HAMP domain-containing sensor histidine kinase [Ruminiclostridium cellobioparum]EMS69674.1 Signal transduction histidine kinase [Ruminiclostridium cellobioparum subsp. termitidis CT1112]